MTGQTVLEGYKQSTNFGHVLTEKLLWVKQSLVRHFSYFDSH